MGDPQIYVRGFPKYTTEEDLKTAFSPHGDIREVRMIRDYAFIVNAAQRRSSTPKSPSNAQSTE
jgi:RNA recognition motif-containing protein